MTLKPFVYPGLFALATATHKLHYTPSPDTNRSARVEYLWYDPYYTIQRGGLAIVDSKLVHLHGSCTFLSVPAFDSVL